MLTHRSTVRFLWVCLAAGFALSACSGGAESGVSSGTNSARAGLAALPAVAGVRSVPASVAGRAGMRRAIAQPACSPNTTTGWVAPISGAASNNVAGGGYASVAGGQENTACAIQSLVGGGQYNGVDSSSVGSAILDGENDTVTLGYYSTIAGGTSNTVNGGFAFIGGGYSNTVKGLAVNSGDSAIAGGDFNTTDHQYDFIGGGYQNTVSAQYAAVAGGFTNHVTGPYGAIGGGQSNGVIGEYDAIGGGRNNIVTGTASAVAGGSQNRATAGYASVAGGDLNKAEGSYAAVPGGLSNVASGAGSFAAGVSSTAGYAGDFVWSDDASGATALSASTANQFLARASGGVTFYSSPNLAAGVRLSPGSGTWSSLSDRNAKSGIVPVSDDDILARVSTLPISEWSYTTERGVRHVGPMAQDFFAAFNVGEDDRHITSIDEEGVALAAIKALNARTALREAALSARVWSLKEEVARKDAALHGLQQRMNALEAKVDSLSASRK